MTDLFSRLRGKFSGADRQAATANFSGRWFTTFGPMELAQNGSRVQGAYQMHGQRCLIEGELRAGRFHFSYEEPAARGEGWFELARHGKFTGEWRATGSEQFSSWTGHREYDGIWESSFGLLRLVQEPEQVLGFYEGQGACSLAGQLEDHRLRFRYYEPRGQGEGNFELDADAVSFHGEWRADGAEEWAPWQGRRLLPVPGMLWLVVLEAHWQRSYLDKEYAFGNMLREFFARLPHVNVRQRFFEDASALDRWCRELMYLPEPVAVVLASHGTSEGLCVQGRALDTAGVIESLRYADNISLLHLSSCWMLQDNVANGFAQALQKLVRFPVTGYARNVDWAASALIEFHYLDMVLGRGLAPADAARQVSRLISYAGDSGAADSPYPPAGFRIFMPTT